MTTQTTTTTSSGLTINENNKQKYGTTPLTTTIGFPIGHLIVRTEKDALWCGLVLLIEDNKIQ